LDLRKELMIPNEYEIYEYMILKDAGTRRSEFCAKFPEKANTGNQY